MVRCMLASPGAWAAGGPGHEVTHGIPHQRPHSQAAQQRNRQRRYAPREHWHARSMRRNVSDRARLLIEVGPDCGSTRLVRHLAVAHQRGEGRGGDALGDREDGEEVGWLHGPPWRLAVRPTHATTANVDYLHALVICTDHQRCLTACSKPLVDHRCHPLRERRAVRAAIGKDSIRCGHAGEGKEAPGAEAVVVRHIGPGSRQQRRRRGRKCHHMSAKLLGVGSSGARHVA